MIVLFDSGPLGMITNPAGNAEARACKAWARQLALDGHLALVPEIVDYEHRRELLLADLQQALVQLDGFKASGNYLPVSEAAYVEAAQFWSEARRRGMPSADRMALDADVILCAQAATFVHADWQRPASEPVVIATTNIGHLTRFADARLWQHA